MTISNGARHAQCTHTDRRGERSKSCPWHAGRYDAASPLLFKWVSRAFEKQAHTRVDVRNDASKSKAAPRGTLCAMWACIDAQQGDAASIVSSKNRPDRCSFDPRFVSRRWGAVVERHYAI